jgi:hypothetical protein
MKTTKRPTRLSIKGIGNWKPSQRLAGQRDDIFRGTTSILQNSILQCVGHEGKAIFRFRTSHQCPRQVSIFNRLNSCKYEHFTINTPWRAIYDMNCTSENNAAYTYAIHVSIPRDTLYPLKLALTSLTNGGRSVGIVRWRTTAPE